MADDMRKYILSNYIETFFLFCYLLKLNCFLLLFIADLDDIMNETSSDEGEIEIKTSAKTPELLKQS